MKELYFIYTLLKMTKTETSAKVLKISPVHNEKFDNLTFLDKFLNPNLYNLTF